MCHFLEPSMEICSGSGGSTAISSQLHIVLHKKKLLCKSQLLQLIVWLNSMLCSKKGKVAHPPSPLLLRLYCNYEEKKYVRLKKLSSIT